MKFTINLLLLTNKNFKIIYINYEIPWPLLNAKLTTEKKQWDKLSQKVSVGKLSGLLIAPLSVNDY